MGKVITATALTLLLTGCFGGELVKPECGEKAVYKKYDITMPVRPALETLKLKDSSTDGEVARAYENDIIDLATYAKQLENILDPIVNGQKDTELKTVPEAAKPAAKEETKHWWNW